jgi:hypothetical protein
MLLKFTRLGVPVGINPALVTTINPANSGANSPVKISFGADPNVVIVDGPFQEVFDRIHNA